MRSPIALSRGIGRNLIEHDRGQTSDEEIGTTGKPQARDVGR